MALERRLDADLALGRFAELVGEVQVLVREHPLRERLRAVLMQALYGSGRQVEALEVYRETRRLLVDELGIEPSPALHELEQAILRQDPALTSQEAPAAPRQRAIMVVATDPERLDDLLAIAEPLARRPARELILARLLRDDGELAAASAALSERRDALAQQGVASRIATYTTAEPGADAVRLATEHDVDLILLDAAAELLESGLPDQDLAAVLERAPCDVGVLSGAGEMATGPVVTPFGGAEHDWTAIEVAAWLAQSLGTTLRLLGTEANPALGRRDASRLLAARLDCSCSRWSESSPSPFSSARAKRVSSKRPATPACSSSASPTAGEPKASATRDWPSLWAPRCRRSSCDAASGPAASPRTRR